MVVGSVVVGFNSTTCLYFISLGSGNVVGVVCTVVVVVVVFPTYVTLLGSSWVVSFIKVVDNSPRNMTIYSQ